MVNNIWIAAADNEINLVKQYITSGQYTANSKDPNGYTPIHAAVSYNNLDLLKILIREYSGDINIQDNEGDTPLHHVEDITTAKILIEEYKADFKIKNNDGEIPADYIEQDNEFPEVVQYLRSLNHENIINNNNVNILDTLPKDGEVIDGHKIKLSYQNDSDIHIDIDDTKREELRKIVEGENAEEGLKNFLIDQVKTQFLTNDENNVEDSPVTKKRRD
ncbi:hypothetical protein WICMUC_001281 [Wickerhamomyces mucosus]|uniref:Ankyrin repeat-containing protein n=1 Tax=Wickerhamomyces mucosus TaxID=1378264 RepID=A0A9P8THQ9_9ASCO|nr:hypothetical protein WICMUC_001281 [Wickerhamomyces mucosus]